jgi:hypothetical protein
MFLGGGSARCDVRSIPLKNSWWAVSQSTTTAEAFGLALLAAAFSRPWMERC